jgi:CubicO group peptidase (beta-lactamase class C family)
MFKTFLVVAALLLAAPPSAQQVTQKFEQYMDAAVKVNHFTGTVLVAREGRPVFSKAYGMASLELDVPNSIQTVFRLGSITKGFTSAAIMLLQERGKLSVHDRMCKYVAGCPAVWEPVTIRHLLSHMSGIKSFTELPDYGRLMPLAVTHETMLARIKDLPLEFPAGEQYKYSNAGYYLLGVVIERASGKPYAEFLQENIFTPLGMTSSGYDSSRRIIRNRASGYTLVGGSLVNALYIDMTIPGAAGALYSSAGDLLRWDQALYGDTVLSRKGRDEMFTPVIDERAYGWAVRKRFGRAVTELDGGINGFSSSLSRFTDGRETVIVLSNNRDVATREIANDLSAILFDAPYTVPLARKAITLDTKTLERYAGQYRFPPASALSPNTIHTVTVENGRLLRRVNEGTAIELFPESEKDFFVNVPGILVSFEVDREGRVTAMILRRAGRETRAEKIK